MLTVQLHRYSRELCYCALCPLLLMFIILGFLLSSNSPFFDPFSHGALHLPSNSMASSSSVYQGKPWKTELTAERTMVSFFFATYMRYGYLRAKSNTLLAARFSHSHRYTALRLLLAKSTECGTSRELEYKRTGSGLTRSTTLMSSCTPRRRRGSFF